MKKINVIVIGSGAYVCGKNTNNFGTILPALIEASRNNIIDRITIVSKHSATKKIFLQKVREIQKLSKVKLNFHWFSQSINSEHNFKNAIQNSDDSTVVIVATPDHLHYEITKFALKHSKHVLVVKPLTSKLSEAKSLAKLSNKKNLLTAVDFHKRLDFANLKIYDIIKNNKIGIPQYFHIEYSQQRNIPLKIFNAWIKHTNIFQFLGVHYVDIISFVTGAIPIRVLSMGQKNVLKQNQLDTYDSIQTIIEWKNKKTKFTSTLLCNWIDPNTTSAVSYQSIKIICSEGRIESDQKNRGLQVISEDGIKDINPYFNQDYLIDDRYHFKGYGIESITQFLTDCIRIINHEIDVKTLSKFRPTFNNTLAHVSVLEAVNNSLKNNGKWIYCK